MHLTERFGMSVMPRPNSTQQVFYVRKETRPYYPKHGSIFHDESTGHTFYAAHRYSPESGIRQATQLEQDRYAYTREFLSPHYRPGVECGEKLPCCNGLAYAVAHNLVPAQTESMPVGELLKHRCSPVTVMEVMEPLPAGMRLFTKQHPFRPAVGNVQKKQTTKTHVYAGGSFRFDFSAAMPTDPTDWGGAGQEPTDWAGAEQEVAPMCGETVDPDLSMDLSCFTTEQVTEIMGRLP